MEDLLPEGVDMVHVQPMIIHYDFLIPENIYLVPGRSGVIRKCRVLAEAHGAQFTLFRSRIDLDERNVENGNDEESMQLGAASSRFGCIDPFYEIKILHTGRIYPCSYRHFEHLDVNGVDLDRLWNGPALPGVEKAALCRDLRGTV